MRFQLQMLYFFIRIQFEPGSARFGSLYLPWEDKLTSLRILSAKCIEHHKVPGEWDDVIQYDGFVFEETDDCVMPGHPYVAGRRWHNQYPRASYGQLDDSNDRRIRPAILSSTTKDHDEIDKIILDNEEEFGDGYGSFEYVPAFLSRLDRAIRQTEPDFLAGNAPPLDPEKKAMLQALYDQIVAILAEKGYVVENGPTTLRFTDGRPPKTVDYIRDIQIVKIAQPA